LWTRSDRITRQNYDRIELGMSRAEVQAILGPAGDYTTGPVDQFYRYYVRWSGSGYLNSTTTVPSMTLQSIESGRSPEAGGVAAGWEDDTGVIDVVFDAQGKVAWTHFCAQQLQQIGPLDKLLWRVQRQWHRWFPD
jgi:hypothetical protein